jgi:Na+:H+ antiporter, NhaC family
MANGFTINSGIGEIDQLLSRGGMDSMLLTLWLIVGAVTFGALLEEFGLIAPGRPLDPGGDKHRPAVRHGVRLRLRAQRGGR